MCRLSEIQVTHYHHDLIIHATRLGTFHGFINQDLRLRDDKHELRTAHWRRDFVRTFLV